MIAADKQELESRLKQVTLQIREKEISVFTDNFAVLSTQSAFLTGLGFGGLTMVPTWQKDEFVQEAVFYTLVSISIGFNVLTLCISSWCMIFGPGLAIRGPDGSMSRAVEGMYAERKWALRFFWIGLFFIMLSGIALGWLKFHVKTASTMTAIFVSFIVVFFLYVKFITRPRFRFPKDAKRKPGEFRVAGYNPETGQYDGSIKRNVGGSGGSGVGAAVMQGKGSRGSSQTVDIEAVARAQQEIEWLQQQGILSEEEARIKLSLLDARVTSDMMGGSGAPLSGSSRLQNLRHRMFGGTGSGHRETMTPTVMSTGSAAGSSGGNVSGRGVGGDGTASVAGSHVGSGGPASPTEGTKSGLLNKDGKLARFTLANRVLSCAALDGSAKKEFVLTGQTVDCVPKSTTAHPNGFILTLGKQHLRLEANSEEEMRSWVNAIRTAAALP